MTELTPRVLLIDLENCPSQITDLMGCLERYSQVVVCYAQSGAKIPIDWIMALTETINDNRLKLFKIPTTGKNSADFGITFWAGVLMAQLPEQTHFDIVSNDTDLDYVVSLLTSQQRSATRLGIKKENVPVLADAKIPSVDSKNHYLREYCLYLFNHTNRPAKKETLLNSINSKFKAENIDGNLLVELLVKQGVITIDTNKITYNQAKLNTVANTI